MTGRAFPDPLDDPAALRVVKKPVVVTVVFADAQGVCETLEGAVGYRPGDAIVTAQSGESWPIARAKFDASYEAVGAPGHYRKRPSVAHALRLRAPARVPVGEGGETLKAKPGDWLVAYADGDHGVVNDAIFRATYAPARGEKRWPPP